MLFIGRPANHNGISDRLRSFATFSKNTAPRVQMHPFFNRENRKDAEVDERRSLHAASTRQATRLAGR